MKTLATVNGVIFAIVLSKAISIGFDIKKWHNWLLGAYAFLTFYLVGLAGIGSSNEAIKAGMLFAFVTMFSGTVMRWNRKIVKKWCKEHDNEQELLDALSKKTTIGKTEKKEYPKLD